MAVTHDVIVIGAGAGGLTAAGACAMWGLRVALIERGTMGGDCLNTGCVPSKALLATAARAHAMRGARFGVSGGEPSVDWAGVRAHLRSTIATIAPGDSRERFEGLGVKVIAGEARFIDRRGVEVAGRTLRAPRIVIATGSRPRIPNLPGLTDVPYLTNETLFDLPILPRHLLVLGGGGIGVEMAQAFRRLGSAVTLVTRGGCLPREDVAAAAIVIDRLREEGVRVLEHTEVREVAGDVVLRLASGETITGSHLLVATGRTVDAGALNLAAAGVTTREDGIVTDAHRRTSTPGIYAIGDCREGPRFTHVSGYEGSLVALRIALGWPGSVDSRALPRATYTDPELAQVGLTEAEARARFVRVTVRIQRFDHDDRAICEGDTTGFVKAVWAGRRLVGATIVGAHAGDLLLPWSMLLRRKASPFALADTIIAYPTRSERSKAVAFDRIEPLLFSEPVKRWAALLAWARART